MKSVLLQFHYSRQFSCELVQAQIKMKYFQRFSPLLATDSSARSHSKTNKQGYHLTFHEILLCFLLWNYLTDFTSPFYSYSPGYLSFLFKQRHNSRVRFILLMLLLLKNALSKNGALSIPYSGLTVGINSRAILFCFLGKKRKTKTLSEA